MQTSNTSCVKFLHNSSTTPAAFRKREYCKRKQVKGVLSGGLRFSTDSDDSLNKIYSERRLMGYSMEQMFDVVLDVAAYDKFLPWCQSSVILSQKPNFLLAELRIGINPLTEKYTSNVTYSRPFSIFAESKQGRLFSHLVNHWKFSPGLKSHPNSCVVDFSVSFKFKSAFQAKLGNVFFDETAKAMTSAFYAEAQRRYGKESVPSMKIKVVPKKNNTK
ncbi:unnamed protein product [Allacma fusca]|uniref:Coenzyme Q-binding protein COQ10 START domain-containing protein n=1 Tax=Allacma fusca TaxID=39272 RepID=A0A8J2NT36_9HEXA|nr:unnamed protein product [Allacma fusca]